MSGHTEECNRLRRSYSEDCTCGAWNTALGMSPADHPTPARGEMERLALYMEIKANALSEPCANTTVACWADDLRAFAARIRGIDSRHASGARGGEGARLPEPCDPNLSGISTNESAAPGARIAPSDERSPGNEDEGDAPLSPYKGRPVMADPGAALSRRIAEAVYALIMEGRRDAFPWTPIASDIEEVIVPLLPAAAGPGWTTVTDDPATWPPENADRVIAERENGDGFVDTAIGLLHIIEQRHWRGAFSVVRWMPWPASGDAP